MKVVITGGSGFIGTNILEFYRKKDFQVYNVDILPPRNKDHTQFWHKIDICDFTSLRSFFLTIDPDFVIHLAAQTDLNENDGLTYYSSIIEGVSNIVKLCGKDSGIKRVLFASSMLVNTVGYKPNNMFDYNPGTLYGKSKVIGEKTIFDNVEHLTEFCVIRPTSIWGEWFAAPYKDFFDYVLSGNFYSLGEKSCIKTYGYVGNSVYQINQLLEADIGLIKQQIFYLGDYPPINISDWANEIACEANVRKPITLPYFVFVLVARFGDLLKKISVNFPMTSFRLNNMTTDHILPLDNLYNVCGKHPFNRVTGIKRTLDWIEI